MFRFIKLKNPLDAPGSRVPKTETAEIHLATGFQNMMYDHVPGALRETVLDVLAAPLRQRNPRMRILMLTGYASIATAVEAIKLGAYDYLLKPIELERLAHAGAGLELGEEGVHRLLGAGVEVEGAGDPLGDHDRDHLRVEDGATGAHDQVDAGSEKTSRLPLEDRRAERPARPTSHVQA